MAAPSRKRARSTWLAPMLSAGFGAGASALGYAPLAPYARGFGSYLGQKFKDITGYGAYTVRKNVLAGEVPSVGNSSMVEGGLTVSHREYLGDVITHATAGEFASYSLMINPGNPQCWEWLAQIACNYEQWVPEGILFCFKSKSSDSLNSVNTALGTVVMATQYDPYAKPFHNKAEMMSYEYCSSGLPSEDIIHMIECDPNQSPISTLDVRGPTHTHGDARFADLGLFTIATSGFQGTNVNIGELWVTYQVTLLKPKLYSALGRYNDYFNYQSAPGVNVGTKGSSLLGSPSADRLSPNTTMTMYPTSNGTYFDTYHIGGKETTGLCVETGVTADILRIYFPLYAYQTTYMILWEEYYNSASTPQDPQLSTGSSYGAASVPYIHSYDAEYGAAVSTQLIKATVTVPGQRLIPYDASLDRPYFQLRGSRYYAGVANCKSFCLTIQQIPDVAQEEMHIPW